MTTGLDGRLILWDAESGKRLKEWIFGEQIGGVALTTDGRHLAVGVNTGVIYILRLAS